MTAPLPDAALAAIEARAAKAREMVAALCLPKGMDGARDWVMSVPAQPSRDPDLILDAALADIPALLSEVRRLREALAGIGRECLTRQTGRTEGEALDEIARRIDCTLDPDTVRSIARAALPEETSNG